MTVVKKKPALITRVKEAKKVARTAQAAAASVHDDETRNRSTRTRASYKIKAAALDEVAAILEG